MVLGLKKAKSIVLNAVMIFIALMRNIVNMNNFPIFFKINNNLFKTF